MRNWLLILVWFMSISLTAGAESLLGHSLTAAKQNPFFKFFALQEEKSDTAGWHQFRPEAPDFRQMVCLRVKDSGAKIQIMDLELARSFVDHNLNGIFARDISRSFLSEGLPSADVSHYSDLISAISKRSTAAIPGYTVYLGKESDWKDSASQCRLEFSNQAATLHLRVSQL